MKILTTLTVVIFCSLPAFAQTTQGSSAERQCVETFGDETYGSEDAVRRCKKYVYKYKLTIQHITECKELPEVSLSEVLMCIAHSGENQLSSAAVKSCRDNFGRIYSHMCVRSAYGLSAEAIEGCGVYFSRGQRALKCIEEASFFSRPNDLEVFEEYKDYRVTRAVLDTCAEKFPMDRLDKTELSRLACLTPWYKESPYYKE